VTIQGHTRVLVGGAYLKAMPGIGEGTQRTGRPRGGLEKMKYFFINDLG
jgi:hypothetical protein